MQGTAARVSSSFVKITTTTVRYSTLLLETMAPKKSSTQEPLLTYTGNCHCKAFVYEVRLPEIKSVTECNCSICHKKGYMWIKLSHGAKISMVGGDKNELSSYTFGKEELAHKVWIALLSCALLLIDSSSAPPVRLRSWRNTSRPGNKSSM